MTVLLTAIVPTHNPRPQSLARTLAALAAQTLPATMWELLIIDNASADPVKLDSTWLERGRVVREERLGLVHARLKGITEAKAETLVWVDDDNVLASNYLADALTAFEADPELGAAGGKSLPEYEVQPPAWFSEGLAPLGCRDLGDTAIYMKWHPDRPDYPAAAPIGAGLVIRRGAMQVWAEAVQNDPQRMSLGRLGNQLTSGEDNDISLTVLRQGLKLAYLPALKLTHLIAAGRLEPDYLARIARVSFRDFIRVLDIHEIRRWQPISAWTYPLRAARAYLRLRAWSNPAAYIHWQSALGQYEGRALLARDSP